jgi:hypothetical protein
MSDLPQALCPTMRNHHTREEVFIEESDQSFSSVVWLHLIEIEAPAPKSLIQQGLIQSSAILSEHSHIIHCSALVSSRARLLQHLPVLWHASSLHAVQYFLCSPHIADHLQLLYTILYVRSFSKIILPRVVLSTSCM